MKQIKLWVWAVAFCIGGSIAYLLDLFWMFVIVFACVYGGINWLLHSLAEQEEDLEETRIEMKRDWQLKQVEEHEQELEKRR